MISEIEKYLKNCKTSLDELIKFDKKEIIASAKLLVKTINGNKKILLCGNGGSASDAQHFAAELIGRFKRDRIKTTAFYFCFSYKLRFYKSLLIKFKTHFSESSKFCHYFDFVI